MSDAGYVSSYEPRAPTPAVGSTWIWEPNEPLARQAFTVTEVKWNGKEWWVRTRSNGEYGGAFWSDLSRFWEAAWPSPDPNEVQVGQEIIWSGRPSFAKSKPSGWKNQMMGRVWSKVGPDRWRRVA